MDFLPYVESSVLFVIEFMHTWANVKEECVDDRFKSAVNWRTSQQWRILDFPDGGR